MESITLQAHYDGRQILLDEPVELQPNTKLLVTVIQPSGFEEMEWHNFSAENLAAAYGDDEPEYPLNLIKEWNPEYEGR
jgi:hypothetical protein